MLHETATAGQNHAQKRRRKRRIQLDIDDIYTQYRKMVTVDHLEQGTSNSMQDIPRCMIDEYMRLRKYLGMKKGIKYIHPKDVFAYVFNDIENFIKYLNDNTT